VWCVGVPCWLQGDRFLSLPLHIFNDFDPDGKGFINLYQLFLMLTLFCIGIPEKKAEMWYAARASCGDAVTGPAFVCVCMQM
jgi:hypothetical protein